MRFRVLARLLHIQRVLIRHGLDEMLFSSRLSSPISFLAVLTPGSWRRGRQEARGVRIRLALEELGPIFVKFGQTLSTRRDLLPEDIASELVKLQDRVPPFPGEDARKIVEQTLGKPVLEVFQEFEETPLASASIAQVHAARLRDGSEVVIKVLRPGIERRIRSDIGVLYELATLARRFWPDARRLRPVEVVAEFEKTLLDELDMVREAANASEIRRRFIDSEMLYIPKVYWEYTRQPIMVMERVSGIPVGDVEQLKREGVNLKLLAERGVEIFFTQVFRDNFFHADMHPGNIFVAPGSKYIAIDFGIVGSISRKDQHYVAENFRAFFNRDYRRVAEMHIESGWVPPTTRVEEFESAIRSVCEPIFEKPLKEISYGHLLLRLFQVARRFDMEVQPQLVLLQKTLLNIEGLGRDLYPELDLWKTAKPFLENWFKAQVGPQAVYQKVRGHLPEWAQQWPEVPGLIHHALARIANSEQMETHQDSRSFDALSTEMRRSRRSSVSGFAGGALIVAAAVLVQGDVAAALLSAEQLKLVAAFSAGAGVFMLLSAWR
jgi:ubiquinone biosynthesis protein